MLVTGRSALSKFLLIVTFLFLSDAAVSQVFPDAEVDSLLRKGINYIVAHQYDEAKTTFTYLDNKFSELPLGKIYLAATKIAYAYDFESPFDEKYIEDNLLEAQRLSENILSRNQNDKWNVYYFALTRGYSAYYQAVKGGWFNALRTGLSSVSAFEKCLELDPEFYEAWIAIGSYEYWKSRKTEFLSWLPFINDNQSFGIEKLKLAIGLTEYNSHTAIHSLLWIYIDQENYPAAAELAEYAVEKHPESRVFRWGLARAYEDIDTKKSINIYYEVLDSYRKSGVKSMVNEITLKHIIAQQYLKLGEKEKAKILCLEILGYQDLTGFEKEKLEDRLKRVRTLLKELG